MILALLRSAELKVGLLVVGVGALIGFMSMRVSEDPTVGGSKKAWFITPNASGLIKNSSVKMAGISVGVIRNITLQDGQARIEIVVRDDVTLKSSAQAELKSNGILGDRFVELSPGRSIDPILADGGQLTLSKEGAGLDSVVSEVGQVASSLKVVADRLKEAVDKDGTDQHVLGRIVQNIEKLTADVSKITNDNKDDIRSIIREIRSVSRNVASVVDDPDKGFKPSWQKLEKTLANLEEITNKVNRGEGTIGKLINDEKTVDNINTAIEGVSGFFDNAGKMQTAVDFHTEYLGQAANWKSYIGLKIQPGLDRYYLLQVVDDPEGVVEKTDTNWSVNNSSTAKMTETKTYHNKTKISLQFAKNFYDFTVRGGLIENSGGVGMDYHFFKQKMSFSMEAFQFADMNLRASLKYNLYKGIYLIGGGNDLLNKSGAQSGFVGAGLFLSNDDVKYFMTKVPL